MAALSANTVINATVDRAAVYTEYTVKTSTVVYKGAICVLNAAGSLQPATNVPTTTVGIGIADSSSTGTFPVTGNGTKTVTVKSNFVAILPCTGVTAGNVGRAAYAANDSTAFDLATLGPQIGVFTKRVSATQCHVLIGGAAMAAAS